MNKKIVLIVLCLLAFALVVFSMAVLLGQQGSSGIIGGADGPTAIFVTNKLAPELLSAIAVAAYSYMALIPLIQPPIMKALTTKKERVIKMGQLRKVSKAEKVISARLLMYCARYCSFSLHWSISARVAFNWLSRSPAAGVAFSMAAMSARTCCNSSRQANIRSYSS